MLKDFPLFNISKWTVNKAGRFFCFWSGTNNFASCWLNRKCLSKCLAKNRFLQVFWFCHTRGGVIKQEEWNPVNRNCVPKDRYFERETAMHAPRLSMEYFTLAGAFFKKVGVDGVPGGLFCHHYMDDQWSLACMSWLKVWRSIQLYFHRLIHCVQLQHFQCFAL